MFNGLLRMFGWPCRRAPAIGAAMPAPKNNARPRRSRGMAGGSLLALSMVAGVVIGTLYGQPSIGFLVGLGAGALQLLLVFLLDRRR